MDTDDDRLDRIESSLKQAHEKLDAMISMLAEQGRPLRVMETHVHNVEAIAAQMPLIGRFALSAPQSQQMLRRHTRDE